MDILVLFVTLVSFNYIMPTIGNLFELINHKINKKFEATPNIVKQPLIGFHQRNEEEYYDEEE